MSGFGKELKALESKVKSMLSSKRFEHTLGVCSMAGILADHCLPEDKDEIIAAALLHDVAKELPTGVLIAMINEEGIALNGADAPPILHSYAAPHVIKSEFPEFATQNILSAVFNHTVGSVDMTVFDEIIFLADYIEEGRTYKDCVETREFMLSSLVKDNTEENINALHKACVMSMQRTCDSLLKKGAVVNPKTLDSIKALMIKIH